MGKGLGQAAGILALIMVVLRLNRLMLSGPEVVRWKMILLAAAILGGVVWWLLRQVTARAGLAIGIFTLGGVLLFLRIAVPESLLVALPTGDTWAALGAEMSQSMRLIRSGVPPIVPLDGVIAILAVLMWAVGALFVWGSTAGPAAAMFVPSLVLYLQFAVFDRDQAGLGWMTASAILLTLSVVALAMERKGDAGRARNREGQPMPRRSPTLAVIIGGLLGVGAIVAATTASGLVSEYGNLPWRTGAGYGLGGGGVSYDRFVDLQQSLLNTQNRLLFQATVGEGAPDVNLYWRMETLDEFDGVGWTPSNATPRQYEQGIPLGDPNHHYQGSTAEVLQVVQIADLQSVVVPVAGTPFQIHDPDSADFIEPRSFNVGQDAAIFYGPGLRKGDRYQVLAAYPLTDEDMGVLATTEAGELSPIFANAVEAGEIDVEANQADPDSLEPADLDFYTRLPDNLPNDLIGQALLRTRGATTNFERAVMLESWFRSEDFIYDATVSTGHSSLNLADWLTDPTSTNYRTGYCEQFATGMAVLGRVLEIPTRVVWGFTPGTTVEKTDADGNPIDVIEVRDTNAHAWVEMWMDGVGWVQFDPTPRSEFVEPTAVFDPTEFLPEDATNSANNITDIPVPDAGAGFLELEPEPFVATERTNWWTIIVPFLVVLAMSLPVSKLLRRRRRMRRLREGDITAAWDEIVDRLADLGRPVPVSSTPMEVARETTPAMIPLASEYSAAVYGGKPGRANESDLLAVETWLHERFDGTDRMRAAFSPRSFFKR